MRVDKDTAIVAQTLVDYAAKSVVSFATALAGLQGVEVDRAAIIAATHTLATKLSEETFRNSVNTRAVEAIERKPGEVKRGRPKKNVTENASAS